MADKNQNRRMDGEASPVPTGVKRVPDVVAENKDWVVNTWLARTKENPELGSLKLSDVERKDHVPDLLDEAVARACEYQVEVEDRQRAAERHGTLRYHQRYSIAMLILEAQLLQEVIAECIRNNVNIIEIKSMIPDIARISGTISAELKDAATAYMNQYEWQA